MPVNFKLQVKKPVLFELIVSCKAVWIRLCKLLILLVLIIGGKFYSFYVQLK